MSKLENSVQVYHDFLDDEDRMARTGAMEGAITHGWAPLHMVTSTVISSSRHRDALNISIMAYQLHT